MAKGKSIIYITIPNTIQVEVQNLSGVYACLSLNSS